MAYSTVLLSVVIAIVQFALHPVKIPAGGIEPSLVGVTEAAMINSPS